MSLLHLLTDSELLLRFENTDPMAQTDMERELAKRLVQTLEGANDAHADEAAGLKSEIEQLEASVSELEDENRSLTKHNAELQRQLEDLQATT